MYNLRYHIASLVSVFLALAIGVILGGLIVDNSGAFDTDKMIRELQAEYDQLRADNEALQARTDGLEELSGGLVAASASGALDGQHIGVLSATDRTVSDHAFTALVDAGATAVTIEIDSKKLNLDDLDPDLAAALAAAGVDTTDGYGAIAEALVAEWRAVEASATPVTVALSDAGVITVDDAFPLPVPTLVGLVNTALLEDEADPLALAISVAFSRAGGPAAGASMVGGSGAVAIASWDSGVSGVGTLGSALGRQTLVALMRGAQEGLYGFMSGATATFAPIPPAGTVTP